EEIGAAVRPAGALDAAIDLVRGRLDARPFLRCEVELERLLFGIASPEPIAGAQVRSRSNRVPARIAAPVTSGEGDGGAALGPVGEAPALRVGGIRRLLGLAQLPEDLDDRVSETMEATPSARLRERLTAALRARSGVLTFGGLVGGGA